MIAYLRWYLRRQNAKKDVLAEAVVEVRDEEFVHAFEDLTDRENANFRYVF